MKSKHLFIQGHIGLSHVAKLACIILKFYKEENVLSKFNISLNVQLLKTLEHKKNDERLLHSRDNFGI